MLGKRFIFVAFICSIGLSAFALPVKQQAPDALFVIIKDNKRGFIDSNGNVIIAPQFGGANNFSEGLAVIATYEGGYKEGYVDTSGRVAIAPQFDAASDFRGGLAAVGFDTERTQNCSDCDPNQHWGYIDKTGTIAIKPQYHHAGNFSEGLAAVETDDEQWGFIDKAGRVVIANQFEYASEFSEGVACVMSNKKYGYIDKTGHMAIKPQFSSCSAFSEGLARVMVGGKYYPPMGNMVRRGSQGKPRFIDRRGRGDKAERRHRGRLLRGACII
jgi:hypothetical protein